VGELQGDLPTAWEADQADFAAWLAGEETARVTEPSLVSGILVEEGAPATGFEELTAAVAPDRAALIAGYERELARGENVADVLQGLKALLAESPEPDPRAARLLGDAYAQAGDYALALETYGSALDML
jgi:tetratricopeptide (TPR) repeat protein